MILKDGRISREEINGLIRWIRKNRNCELPEVASLTTLMREIVSDKVVTKDELSRLQTALESIIGDSEGS